MNANSQHNPELNVFAKHKKIPKELEANVLKALSCYPELNEAHIDFIFKNDIKNSVMQAQPVFRTLLRRKKNRRYRINISSWFKLVNAQIPILEIPGDVLIGWIGHELGHILDYEGKTNGQLVSFGYQYLLSSKYVKKAEMVADTLAVERGMGKYIIATKRFILDHADLPQAYKDKVSRLYLSPDVIMEQVRKLEEKQMAENKVAEH